MSGLPAIGALGGALGGVSQVQQIIALRQQLIERSQLLQQLHAPQAPAEPSGPAGGFASTLQNALAGVNAAQGQADSLTTAYERGETTDVAKVMLAREQAGVAFEATLQVRNRLLTAYQDIMRMGV